MGRAHSEGSLRQHRAQLVLGRMGRAWKGPRPGPGRASVGFRVFECEEMHVYMYKRDTSSGKITDSSISERGAARVRVKSVPGPTLHFQEERINYDTVTEGVA